MPSVREPLRVGYVLKRFPRLSETFILNELLAHEAAGVEAHVFALRKSPEEPKHARLADLRAGVTRLHRPKGPGVALLPGDEVLFAGKEPYRVERLKARAFAVAEEAAARGIRHLHAHFGSDATTVALLAAREMGGTFSYTAHARDIFHRYVSPEADAAMRRAKMRAAAFIVTVSEYNARHLRALCPEAARRVRRLYNGIDLDAFRPVDPASQKSGRLLAVGRLIEKKGFAVLVDACASLQSRGVVFDLEIVGDGPDAAALQSRIAAHGLDGRVRLVGPMPQEDLVLRMGEAQAAVLPCVVAESGDRDGLPTVLLEAMGRGLPVVTTTVSGGPEIVENGGTGLLCKPGDAQSLADALALVLGDQAAAAVMGRAGRARAERLFDLNRNAATLRGWLAAPESAARTHEAA